MRLLFSILVLGLLFVGLAPALAQEPPAADIEQTREEILAQPGQPITFYGHIFSFGRDEPMPMNTQFPAGEADYSIGTATGCGNPPPAPADTECETAAFNTQLWYSTAGFVQVKTAEESGCNSTCDYSLFHNERGLTKDVYVDTSQKPVSTYYMSADFHGWPVVLCTVACWNWDPGMFQDWVVESWLWSAPLGELHANATEEPDMSQVVERGPRASLLAHGKTAPFDMVSLDPTIPTGQQTVWPFVSEMEWDPAFLATDGRIPLESNIVMEFRWYQETDGQKYIIGAGAPTPNWNVNSGEDYPANVVLPVRNPIDVEIVYPQFIHEKLVVLSVINTPWGSYDIDPELVKLVVKDSSGTVVPFQEGTLTQVFDQSVSHAGHYQAIKPTWVWDYKAQGLKPGDYSVTVEVTNFQHSVTTDTTGLFSISASGAGTAQAGQSGLQTVKGNLGAGLEGTAADPNAAGATPSGPPPATEKESPGPGLPALALAAVAAMLMARRRRA